MRGARDLVCVMEVGRRGYMGFLLFYVSNKSNQIKLC